MDKKFTIIVRELDGDQGWTTELWDIDANKIIDCIALQSTLRDAIKAANEYIREHKDEVQNGISVILRE